jgi:hypothetical protein
MNRVSKTFVLALVCALAFGVSGRIAGQDPGGEPDDGNKPNPQDLARQIRRNMIKIEEELSKAGTHDPSKGEQVRKDLENLLETMKQRQGQVVKDIDAIVEQMKCNGGGGSGSKDSNENQGKSKSRDRNKPENQGKPRDPNSGEQPGKKPKDGKKPSDQKGGGAEDNRRKAEDEGHNQPGDPRGEPPPERFVKIDLNEIWGNLPSELRQKLVDRNFDDFTPEYKAQIDEYFRKTSSAPKR